MKTCKSCKCETEALFAPFDQGVELYCSDCQMEIECEEIDSNDCYQDSYDVYGY